MNRFKRLSQRRGERGASIALAAAFIFVCILLIYFGFNMSVLMGGSRQVRNAVDAAVLNVGKRVVETKVSPTSAYSDVADSSGQVGLSNINRVWGKAMLINANAKEMQVEGQSTGKASGNANLAYQMAMQVNNNLVEKLGDQTTLNMYFRHTAKQRGAALLGAEAKLDKAEDTTYQTAMVGRGDESNINFRSDQIPQGSNVNGLDIGGNKYLEGYQDLSVNGKTFMFTTFRAGEMPHLISDSTFDQCRAVFTPLGNFPRPVPNSWYVMVALTNRSFWYNEGKIENTIDYGQESKMYHGLKGVKLSDDTEYDGYAELGNEFKAPSLLGYIDQVPGDKEIIYDKITQRLKEVDGSFNKKKLKTLLNAEKINKGTTVYYLFPNYASPDNTDPQITVEPREGNVPSWIDINAPETADGAKKGLIQENVLKGLALCRAEPLSASKQVECQSRLTGVIYWKPGTGFTRCLGEVHLARETKLYFYLPGGEPI